MSLPSADRVHAAGQRGRGAAAAAARALRWSYGFLVAPNSGLNVCDPAPNSGTLVLPIVITPARRIRSMTSASSAGT